MLRDAQFRIGRESRVQHLDGGERRQRAVGRGVTGRSITLQVLDASLQLTTSLLNMSLCVDGLRGPHSCTMIWMSLMNWILVTSFLLVTIPCTPKLA